MKKIIAYICTFAIILSLPFLTACDRTKNENHNTDNIMTNGGLMAISGDYMYYINGVEDRTTINKDITTSAIYKVKVDNNGVPQEESTILVSSIAGFEDGAVYVFGDYVYYATPSAGRDNKGAVTSQLTSFYRIKTDGTKKQHLYTTKTESTSETLISYAYYKTSEKELYLMLYENDTIYSILIGSKVKVNKLETSVDAVVMTETNGLSSEVDKYIYFSKTPLETDSVQTGHNIFRMLPNGEEKISLSTGKDLSLLQIKNGKLYFLLDDVIYSTGKSNTLSYQNAISYGSFTNFIVLKEGGIAGVVDSKTYYFKWENNNITSHLIYDNGVDFVTEHNGMVYFIYNGYLYRINPYEANSKATKISTAIVSFELGSYLMPKIFGNRIMFYTEEKLIKDSGASYSVYHLSYVDILTIEKDGNTAERVNA